MHTPSYLKELSVGDSYDHPYFMAKHGLKNKKKLDSHREGKLGHHVWSIIILNFRYNMTKTSEKLSSYSKVTHLVAIGATI